MVGEVNRWENAIMLPRAQKKEKRNEMKKKSDMEEE